MSHHSIRPTTAYRCALACALLALASNSANAQTNIVIRNNTGLPDDQVYVTLQGASTFSGAVGGGSINTTGNPLSTTLSQNTSYSLAQLQGTLGGASGLAPQGRVAIMQINQFANGGVMLFTLGKKIDAGIPDYTTVYGRFEAFMDGSSTANNVDISYVDGIGLPMSFSVLNVGNASWGGGGELVPLPHHQGNVPTTPGNVIFDKLHKVAPTSAIYKANYTTTSTASSSTLYKITGTSHVLAPSKSSDYHSWLTPDTGTAATMALIPYMRSNNLTTQVASYIPTGSAPLTGTNFGYAGTPPIANNPAQQSPFSKDNYGTDADPNNLFMLKQSYSLTAHFSSDLNPNGSNTAILTYIPQGTKGIKLEGWGYVSPGPPTVLTLRSSNAVGSFNVYITDTQLTPSSAIYGANPQYVVEWTGHSTDGITAVSIANQTFNTNSLVDRVVGDLLTVMNFGSVNSSVNINQHAIDTNTLTHLAGSIFGTAGTHNDKTVGELTTGEYIYLLSLQKDLKEVGKWSGSFLQTNDLFYNVYADALQPETSNYTLSYSDRIQSPRLSPDVSYAPSSQYLLSQQYIEIVLEPGGYEVTAVPEPATALAWASLGGLAALRIRRRNRLLAATGIEAIS